MYVSMLICIKDFSDRLTRRRKAMYRTFVKRQTLETSEYELIPKELALQETSLQKLRRLQFELQELSEEVEKKKVGSVLVYKILHERRLKLNPVANPHY